MSLICAIYHISPFKQTPGSNTLQFGPLRIRNINNCDQRYGNVLFIQVKLNRPFTPRRQTASISKLNQFVSRIESIRSKQSAPNRP